MRAAVVLALVLLAAVAVAAPVKKAEISFPKCETCELVVKALEAYVESSTTEAEIEQGLERICNILPKKYQPVCELAKTQVPALLELLIAKETPEVICQQLKLCATQEKTPNDWECSLCELVASKIENLIGSNRTEQRIEEVLDQVCNLMPGFKEVCKEFIDEYTPELVQLLLEYESPAVLCQQLGLCSAAKKAQEANPSPIECELCKVVVGELEALVETNRSEAAIEAALDKVCNAFGQYGSVCRTFIDTYTDDLIKLLEEYESAEVVCRQLHLCIAAAERKVNDPQLNCVLCKMAVSYFQLSLQNETADVGKLEALCHFLPGKVGEDCKMLVDTYGATIVELLESMTPEQICSFVQLCVQAPSNGVDKCTVCELLVGEVSSLLSDGKTEAAITAEVQKLCNKLPTQYQTICKDAVAAVVPDMISLLEAKIDPEKICQFLGMCRKAGVNGRPGRNDAKCTLCEWAVKLMDAWLERNQTEQEIRQKLDQACSTMGPFSSECAMFVDDYFMPLLEALIQHEDPDTLCTQLHICGQAKAFGAHRGRMMMMRHHKKPAAMRLN